MLESRTLLTRNIDQTGELITLSVKATAVTKEHLNHSRMVPGIISWPRCAILHNPSFLRYFLCLSNKAIDPNFKFFIFSLHGPAVFNK
uniref:CesA-4 n=1 Tax=Arundo donax TaxID=35708 RepID=A0A0A9CQW5_ARUDO